MDNMQQIRRKKTQQTLERLKINYLDSLPYVETSNQVKLKDIDTICKRAIASLVMTQLACSITNGENYNQSKDFVIDLLKRYGVENCLNDLEKKLLLPDYTSQNVLDVEWEYECYWALCWALGLIEREEIDPPFYICDCNRAIALVAQCSSYKEFKNQCKMRNIEEILDMLDLFYNYHWACVDKTINPTTQISELNNEIVFERRRALEWLFSKEEDWHDISLDT